MTKVSRKPMDPNIMGKLINELWSAFTLMATKEDIRLLCKDLLTHTELAMFAKRLAIARMLQENYTYDEIQSRVEVTPGTVNHVSQTLVEKGQGYREAHKVLLQQDRKRQKREEERQKNWENPFRQKAQRKTLGGALVKAGVSKLDRLITKKLKESSAKKTLPA